MSINSLPAFIVWWDECADIAPVRVRARDHEQAAVMAAMREWSSWTHHENVPDMDRLFVADATDGRTWIVGVKLIHQVESAEVNHAEMVKS